MSWLTNAVTTRNVSSFDRWLRTLPALLVVLTWWQEALDGAVLVTFAVLAGMLLFTSLSGTCSIYYVLGISSCGKQ